jgi:branched-chain amino acid aminotransferase
MNPPVLDPHSIVWMDGELIEAHEAKVSVMSHALHYGSSVFEGVRSYENEHVSNLFRLEDHLRRLQQSARIHRIDQPYSIAEWTRACEAVVQANRLGSAYLRPLVWKGAGGMGVSHQGNPSHALVAAWQWPALLGEAARNEGVDVCISSWSRPAANTLPAMAKAAGNYLSSALIHDEAVRNGYHEGIALTTDGLIGEGAGENLFLVSQGRLLTPSCQGGILAGITRDTVMQLARRLGLEVEETTLPREALLIADEIFLTGTAAEITPVRSVDRVRIGAGNPGPVTRMIQAEFFGLFAADAVAPPGWLHPIPRFPAASLRASR